MNGIGKTNEYKLRGNDPSALLWEINSNDLLFPDLQSEAKTRTTVREH